jgi:hypothetical protein
MRDGLWLDGRDGELLSRRCGVDRRDISPSRMSMWPCRTGRTRFPFAGGADGTDFALLGLGAMIGLGWGGVKGGGADVG